MPNTLHKIKAKLKPRAGYTLVEVLVSLALLAMVIWIAGGAVYMASSSYGLTARMQNDEYAARTAMLNISRELHRGWPEVTFTPRMPKLDASGQPEIDPNTGQVIMIPATLTLIDNTVTPHIKICYILKDDGIFTRTGDTNKTPVHFEKLELKDFDVQIIGVSPNYLNNIGYSIEQISDPKIKANPKLKITLTCENGLEVSTTVALLRIPPASSSSQPPPGP